mgnify:CR=1 FL=1
MAMTRARKRRLVQWIAVGAVVITLGGVAAVLLIGHREPGETLVKAIPVADGGEGVIWVTNSGVVEIDGEQREIVLDKALPADVRAHAQAALDAIDPTSPDALAQAEAALADTIGQSGKYYLVIVPAVISCDGDEYFSGFMVAGYVGDGRPDLCESQRTLEGAREMAKVIAGGSPRYEIFEVGNGQAVPFEPDPYTPAPPAQPDPSYPYEGLTGLGWDLDPSDQR